MTPRTPRFKLGLTLRIILALALVGLGPLLVAFFLLVRIQREGYGDQVLVTHSVAARTAAERTASFLDSLAVVGRTLAGNSALLADPRSPSAQELLRGTLESRPDIALLALLDARGELVVQGARRDLSAEVSALATGSGTDNLAVTRFEGVPWLAWDFPLEGGQGRLRLIASGKGLAESIRGYEMSAEEAALVVIDQDRQLVTGTTESLEEFAPEQLAAAATGKVAGAGEYRDAAGASVLGAFAPVGRQGWYVLSRQPARLAERITQGIRRDSVRSLGLALLLVAALSSLGHLGLVRPLRRLAGAQRELAGVAAAPSGNELEDLRNAFEALEQRVRHHQELDRIFLGRYQVVRLLGHGAMGTVFLGWDPKLERQLALKTVRLGTDLAEARRRELSAKLMQEAVTAARFLHPNIIAVYDVEAAGDLAFLAMEYLEGCGLERLLWRRGALAEDQAVTLALAVARALAAAHGQGVVHRDIKPSNVLLGFDGSIKVTDFGIAELVSATNRATDTFFGTPGYVPPETLVDGGYSETSDLFSLGVVLYECLTGIQPFAGRDVHQTLRRTVEHHPDAPQVLRPELSAEINHLVLTLLEKRPRDRYSSAAALVSALERLNRGSWDAGQLPRDSEHTEIDTVIHSQLLPTLSRGTGPRRS